MKKQRFHLGFLLVIYTIVSVIAGALVFAGMSYGGMQLLNKKIYTREKILETEKELCNDYLEYLNTNGGKLNSRKDGLDWLAGREDVMIAIYNGGSPFADSESGVMLISASGNAPALFEMLRDEYSEYWYTCPVITSSDRMRTKLVQIMYFPMYRARSIVIYSSTALAFIVFVLMLTGFIRVKTRYIKYLSDQLNIMEGGELNIQLKLKGSDELTSLASNMDSMRLSFIERLEHEENMERSRNELMTAMSHDLRTPLTALMGYLELIDSGAVSDAEKSREYIASAVKRARQLKGMTDELFEYFLVYSGSESEIQLDEMDAVMLFSQLLDESAFTLESEGYTVETKLCEDSCVIRANPQLLHRVFDNIVSNIRKYAEKTSPVVFEMVHENGMFTLRATNLVGEVRKAESSGIGLMSCRKILSAHSGSFTAENSDGRFTAEISLPEKQQ